MIVFGASAAGLTIPFFGRIAYLSTRALTGAAAAGAAAAVADIMSAGVGEIIAASTVAALVAEVLDAGFASTTHRLRGNGRWVDAAGCFSHHYRVGPPLRASRHLAGPWRIAMFLRGRARCSLRRRFSPSVGS